MNDIKLCKECWHWIAPEYSERPGKCALDVYEAPYADTRACDEYDGKTDDDDEDYCVNAFQKEVMPYGGMD